MATESIYFLNGLNLASSTAVFADENLTVCAADGFYRQEGVVRQMVNCVLLDTTSCRSCATACGLYIEDSLPVGLYSIPIEAGTNIGAVIIKFNPNSVPNGIIANFNGVNFNKTSSTNFGYLAAPSNLITYLGVDNPALIAGSPYTLENYNFNGVTFDDKGTVSNVTIVTSQVKTTATVPGDCIMVIPKTVVSPSIIDISIVNTFSSGTFGIDIGCPEFLQVFHGGIRSEDLYLACESIGTYPYYSAPVNGNGIILGLWDWVFSDMFGQNVLPNGYYLSADIPFPNEWFRTENGTVVEFGMCTSPPMFDLGYLVSNDLTSCSGNVSALNLKVTRGATTYIDTITVPESGTVNIPALTYDVELSFTWTSTSSPCCEGVMVIVYNGIEIASLPLGIPITNPQNYTLSTTISLASASLLTAHVKCL
jgi:hypothetical protein